MTHLVAGIYTDREAATRARDGIAAEIPQAQRILAGPTDRALIEDFVASQDTAGEKPTVAGGAAVGGGIGLAGGALAGAVLVVAGPVATALAGAGLGALAGAAAGKTLVKPLTGEALAEILSGALECDHWVLVAAAPDEGTALEYQDLIERTNPQESVDHGGGIHTDLR